jgi:superfamily II DNA/RNA helicase
MTRDAEELVASLRAAPEYRQRLLALGQAQSMIRRSGVLPQDAPNFDSYLDNDLLNYSYALIVTSLDLLDSAADEVGRDTQTERLQLAREGFVQASYALEAATRNAAPSEDLVFHRLIAGAASHLGGYAARAFSLVQASIQSGRMTPMEVTLADLISRNLDRIEERTRQLRSSPGFTDDAVLQAFQDSSGDDRVADRQAEFGLELENALSTVGPVVSLLSEHYMSAVSTALFAIAYNQQPLLRAAIANLRTGEQASNEINAPGPWWVYRLTRRLIGDLGQTSIRANIPRARPPAATASAADMVERHWGRLRNTFVASLFARKRSEIDLWPSQLHVVDRIFNSTGDLVVALPTSAGKTRIAELSILACLAQGRRAVYVTPLRALSAQTERILARTFTPLGATVSSLYGSMGMSNLDEDALRTSDIVVTTPEKLDFALRSNPSVLDDVGVVVLDEGHMIGPSEREIRYEAQVQRLLRRADSEKRRIICLSAVFPSGDDLNDFVAWITNDDPDGLHHEQWRPTEQQFGRVQWQQDHARLTITIGSGQSFIPRFIEAKTPTAPRKKLFPANNFELIVTTAWRLVEEGQTVLIFCPQRNQVGPYAEKILKLRQQGLIDSILPAGVDLTEVRAVGTEWFGAHHPILECLELGVAIHHGALPGPFRREVERLLHDGVIKVTVASPTLAQGLNLSASVVLFHGIHRHGTLLTGSEFSNVIGRAGRAFVDTEGLVLYPLFKPTARRLNEWKQLTTGEAGKALRSGLISIGVALINRVLTASGTSQLQSFIDYVTGGYDWAFPVAPVEGDASRQIAETAWDTNLALLDTSILSIAGEDESDPDQVTQLLVDMLRDSLWERQLLRAAPEAASALREVVTNRARYIWSNSTPVQRRGWYLAGLGAKAGFDLGSVAADVVETILLAEVSIEQGDSTSAIEHITRIADRLFAIDAFKPETPLNWKPVLAHWLSGRPLGELEEDRLSVVQFIEADLSYRLVWGMEAARVYASAQGNLVTELLDGTATAAIETGTLNRQASILIRSGFDHRSAAINAVESVESTFESTTSMRQWIKDLPPSLVQNSDWPTAESHKAWSQFTNHANQPDSFPWVQQIEQVEDVQWDAGAPAAGAWLRVTDISLGVVELWSAGFDFLGEAHVDINPDRQGVLHARRRTDTAGIELRYRGPSDLLRTTPSNSSDHPDEPN